EAITSTPGWVAERVIPHSTHWRYFLSAFDYETLHVILINERLDISAEFCEVFCSRVRFVFCQGCINDCLVYGRVSVAGCSPPDEHGGIIVAVMILICRP